jgi:hypothetical protein
MRDGLRWHLIEDEPGRYRWDSWSDQLHAAADEGVTIWWDLIHFGFPSWCHPLAADFAARAADFAAAAAERQRAVTGQPGRFCPINEISFLAFAAGQMGWFAPHLRDQGDRLKAALVEASLAMAGAIRAADRQALLLAAEPLIHVAAPHPDLAGMAEREAAAQFDAIDWLLGRARPELGGHAGAIDVIGFNHYPHNQRLLGGEPIGFGTYRFVALSDLLEGCARRYPGIPMLLAETGAEGPARAPWLVYVAQELEIARDRGLPVVGACLYPVTDYPGWDDGRHCPTGLLGLLEGGQRSIHRPSEVALRRLLDLGQTAARAGSAPSLGAAHGSAPASRPLPGNHMGGPSTGGTPPRPAFVGRA